MKVLRYVCLIRIFWAEEIDSGERSKLRRRNFGFGFWVGLKGLRVRDKGEEGRFRKVLEEIIVR